MATASSVQYSGIWNLSSQANAKAAGTWPRPPGAPTIGTATAGSLSASVTFTAPTDLGIPATITSYTVTSSPGGFTGTGSASPITVSGLTNGTAYTFTVTATNATGTGPASAASNSVTPALQPTVFIWGDGATGKLGLGNITSYSSPTQLGSGGDWGSTSSAINARANFLTPSFVKNNGTLWRWGTGDTWYNMGNGVLKNYSSPVQVGSASTWSFCVDNGQSSGAVKTDGTLWTWGYNNDGQLGLGTSGSGSFRAYTSPTQVGASTNWAKLVVANGCMISIKTDGTLWSWGQGGYSAQSINYSSPVQVGALTNWSKLSVGSWNNGGGSTHAIKTDGTLWSWGDAGAGQTGLGNLNFYSSPKQVGTLTNWLSVAGGGYHVAAVKTDGTLWTWGSGSQGQLGLGNTNSYSSPKQVGGLTTWSQVWTGLYQTLALKTDGTLWSWGFGYGGQLGLGNETTYSSPKQVGALTSWVSGGAGGNYGFAIRPA